MSFLCETCPLRQTGVCAKLIGAEEINPEIASKRESRSLPAKRYLQTSGNPGNELRIIREGWAATIADCGSAGVHVSQILLPGDPVAAALASSAVPPRTVRSLTALEYCGFDGGFIRTLIRENEWAQQLLLDITYQRTLDLQARLADLGVRDAEGRIVSLLLDIYRRLETRGLASGGTCDFRLSQQIIAEATGLTQVHVSRVLKTLRERKLLWTNKQTLHIPDVERAQHLLQ